jgi:hypothetical protein
MHSDFNIIGDVTHALEDLLGVLTPSLDSPADLQIGDNNDAGRINIYLYQVLENAYAKNRVWGTRPNGDLQYPSLALNLYYLLTPYASDQLTAHHILSDAMRILHDNSLIRGTDLPDSLRPLAEQLAIALVPLQLEELTRIWNALQSAYRLSVAYEVRIVMIESQIERTPDRVLTKLDNYAQL